ncbi:MAG TPA: hypothetical protein VGK69_05190 [Gaiellaceae bacterium]
MNTFAHRCLLIAALAASLAVLPSAQAVVGASGYGFGTRECGSHRCAARVFRIAFVVH